MKDKVIIVDLEDTLTDASHRGPWKKDFIPADAISWHKGLAHDGINAAIISLVETSDYPYIVVSSKPIEYAKIALTWIEMNIIKKPEEVYFRPLDNISPDAVVKETILGQLCEDYEPILAIDDNPKVCNMYKKYVKTLQVLKSIPVEQKEKKSVAEILRTAADFFEERDGEYGSAYLMHGGIMKDLFPDGITLKTADDFYHFHILVLKVVKMTRIAVHWSKGKGQHVDSYLDDIIYGAMALEQTK